MTPEELVLQKERKLNPFLIPASFRYLYAFPWERGVNIVYRTEQHKQLDAQLIIKALKSATLEFIDSRWRFCHSTPVPYPYEQPQSN
jgi:hypothetical protein